MCVAIAWASTDANTALCWDVVIQMRVLMWPLLGSLPRPVAQRHGYHLNQRCEGTAGHVGNEEIEEGASMNGVILILVTGYLYN